MQLDEATTAAQACRALWLAVLAAAAEEGDAAYFDAANSGFRYVCWLADVEPEWVAAKMRGRLAAGRVSIVLNRGQARPQLRTEAQKAAMREGWRRRRERLALAS
jgi:hypothetical protein